jgi:hypothetical protein
LAKAQQRGEPRRTQMMCATRAEDVPSNPDRKQGQARSGLPSPFPVYIIRMGRPGQLTSLTVSVHSRAAEVCHMLRCMYFVQDKQTDFSVVIKIRGKLPNPWRWEIYRAGHSRAIAQSSEFFSTVSAAKKSGRPRACRTVREPTCFIMTARTCFHETMFIRQSYADV